MDKKILTRIYVLKSGDLIITDLWEDILTLIYESERTNDARQKIESKHQSETAVG